MAVRRREDLLLGKPARNGTAPDCRADEKLRIFFWPVATSAAGERRSCNSCEADVNVLGTIGWDLGRFGIQFVASPRQVDSLLIAGGVSDNL